MNWTRIAAKKWERILKKFVRIALINELVQNILLNNKIDKIT